MYEKFFLKNWLHLSDANAVQELSQAAQIVHIKKNSLLIESGEIQTQIPILLSGVFRGFLLDADGKDITDCFVYRSGEVVMGCNPLGKPSQINLESMSDCEIVTIPISTVLPMMDLSLELLRIYNRYLVEALERHWEGKMLMHRYSAMQRYQWFLKNYPGLIDTVSNKHIASFLGMTPVTLSRLRRQLRDREKTGQEGE